MKTAMACAAVLVLFAGCKRETPVAAPRAPEFQFFYEASAPQGVIADLNIQHFAATSFSDLSSVYPDEAWAGAVVEGNSFEAPTDVYVLSLTISNSSDRPVRTPDIVVRASTMLDGEPELQFRPAPRLTLEPGRQERVHFFWDPGQRVPVVWAKLHWLE